METEMGTLPSDGGSVPDYGALVREDRVHTSLYRDPALFEAEMERIFSKTWVWVAHASELPGKNSFKTAHVGRQPVIVTRDRDGISWAMGWAMMSAAAPISPNR